MWIFFLINCTLSSSRPDSKRSSAYSDYKWSLCWSEIVWFQWNSTIFLPLRLSIMLLTVNIMLSNVRVLFIFIQRNQKTQEKHKLKKHPSVEFMLSSHWTECWKESSGFNSNWIFCYNEALYLRLGFNQTKLNLIGLERQQAHYWHCLPFRFKWRTKNGLTLKVHIKTRFPFRASNFLFEHRGKNGELVLAQYRRWQLNVRKSFEFPTERLKFSKTWPSIRV